MDNEDEEEEEGELDLYNNIAIMGIIDDAFWLYNVSRTENSTTHPTSVSTPITDVCSGSFGDLLDPALYRSEDAISQPSSSGPS